MKTPTCACKEIVTAAISEEDAEPPGTNAGLAGLFDAVTSTTFAPVPTIIFDSPEITNYEPRNAVVCRDAASVSSWNSAFRRKFFPAARRSEWNDWHWQLRHRITDGATLSQMLVLSEDERLAIEGWGAALPLNITPYYASLLDPLDPEQPLRRSVVPNRAELTSVPGEADDPLGEDEYSPVPGLVHRYPDRVLFLVTGFCSTYCRYCTRSRIVGNCGKPGYEMAQWNRAIAYIENTPTVRDVLISGGDPLTLSDEKLEWLLSRLRSIPHLDFVRIGTKAPAVLPQRITPALTRMLKRYHPLWMSLHFTHPDELTPETRRACERLADAGIPLGSQTVLLSGINDDVMTMRKLMQGLLKIRVKPYYIYQCDPISGSSHFRTTVSRGLEIIQGLRGFTSGYAVPHYVIDAPGSGGKIPLLPDYVAGRDGDFLLLKNYEGKIYRYPDNISVATGGEPAGLPRLEKFTIEANKSWGN